MDTSLRILHVGKYYPPYMGGIETHLQTLCNRLSASMDVSVMVSNSNSSDHEELIAQVPVARIGRMFNIGSAPMSPGMVSRLRSCASDIVHIHLPNPTSVLAYLASGHAGTLVVTYHSDTVRQPILGACFEPILQRFLSRSAAIIATSPDYLRTSPVLYNHRDRCHVVPYGIPLEQFATADQAEVSRIRARFGDRLIIAVGRLVYYKGFEYLIQAMTGVRGRLLLVGDGPLRASLERLAASCGVSGRVEFLGQLQNEQVVPYYHAADVFVLPSIARSEAFGIVQIEAMAAGIPVINTSLDSGVPFVSRHGVTGLTVPSKDPIALAHAINTVLDDDQLRASYSKAARLRARSEFSVETMAERIQAIYQSVASQATPRERVMTVGAGSQ